MGQTFFGLTNKYMESVYEQIFSMMHHGNWSFSEIYSLPVGLRYWFFNRLVKQFEEEKRPTKPQQGKPENNSGFFF